MKKRSKAEKIFTLDFDGDRLAAVLCDATKHATLQLKQTFSSAGFEADYGALAVVAVREVAPFIQQDFEDRSARFAKRFLATAIYRAFRRAVQKMCEASGQQYTRSMDAIIRKSARELSKDAALAERNLPPLGSTSNLEPLTDAQLAKLAPKVESVALLYAAANASSHRGRTRVADIVSHIRPQIVSLPADEQQIVGDVLLHFEEMSWIENGEAVGPTRLAHEHARRALHIGARSARSLETDVSRSRALHDVLARLKPNVRAAGPQRLTPR